MPLISSGICICHTEPRGQYRLEVFDIHSEYKYERMSDGRGNYIRVYHSPTYYETCGVEIFLRYFKIKKANK